MNKYEALVITGKLEIQLQGQKQHLNEIAKLQKCIAKDDLAGSAISFGRLSEISKNPNADVKDNLDALSKFVLVRVAETEPEQLVNIPVEALNLSEPEQSVDIPVEDLNSSELQRPADDISIEELELSVRAFSCLWRAGKKTVGDILKIPKSVLRDSHTIRNLGKISAEEIINKVESMGFKMKD